jgi:Kef-type K+ transport system membrane component KefB
MTSQQSYDLLFDIALILVLAHTLGFAARKLGQPAVVGEILLGILLGPTLLPAAFSAHLIPVDVRPSLSALADIGVAVFMFVVGLEVDHRILRGESRRAAGAAAGAMALPLALGCLLAAELWYSNKAPSHIGFVLFFGTAMSMTAFPVLARILAEDKMRDTEVAGTALTAAAIGDVAVWSMLALVLAFTDHQNTWHLLLALPYVALMLFGVRPALARLMERSAGDRTSTNSINILIVVIVIALASGGATQWFGLDFIFGAFFAGLIVPRSSIGAVREQISERVGVVGNALLMPIYFVMAGLNVNLRTVGRSGLVELGLILVTAIGGKLIGGYLGARASGLPSRQSTVVGVLMNTRGLTELIILGIGLQAHYLDTRLYSLMVAMAVVTTAMTGPLLQLIYPVHSRVKRPAVSGRFQPALATTQESEA